MSKGITRWWFQGFLIFTPKIWEHVHFDEYFSDVWFNHQLDKHVGQCFVWNHFINPRKFKNQRLKRSTWTMCVSTYYHMIFAAKAPTENTPKKRVFRSGNHPIQKVNLSSHLTRAMRRHPRGGSYPKFCLLVKHFSGWWFQIFFIFTPIWGRFPFWLIFFKGVETTKQFCLKKKVRWDGWKPMCWEVQRNIWKSISLELYFPAWTRLN